MATRPEIILTYLLDSQHELIRLTLILVVLVTWLTQSCVNAQPRYTRNECIVKVRLYWPSNISDDKAEHAFAAMSDTYTTARKGRQDIVAGWSIKNRDTFYIMYRDRCNKKQDMARDFMENFWITNAPWLRYEVLDEIVTPRPETIDIRGPYWSDGMPLLDKE
jgi:hypothetical protein